MSLPRAARKQAVKAREHDAGAQARGVGEQDHVGETFQQHLLDDASLETPQYGAGAIVDAAPERPWSGPARPAQFMNGISTRCSGFSNSAALVFAHPCLFRRRWKRPPSSAGKSITRPERTISTGLRRTHPPSRL